MLARGQGHRGRSAAIYNASCKTYGSNARWNVAAALVWLMVLGVQASDDRAPLAEAVLVGGAQHSGHVEIMIDAGAPIGAGERLLLTRGVDAWTWCRPEPCGHGGATGQARFRPLRDLPVEGDGQPPLRAFLVPADLASRLSERWPAEADWYDIVETVGPGQEMAWLRTSGPPPAVDDAWLLREAGQPIARLEAVWVGERTCCRMVRLVADARLAAGDRVVRWPGWASRRAGRCWTAVAHVEPVGEVQRVWVAAPPGVALRGEATVDFARGGRFVGSGLVERRDARFWYVRTSGEVRADRVRVGDECRLRTPELLATGGAAARLFAAPGGLFVNAGEIDGVRSGMLGLVYREGRFVGEVRLEGVQAGYAAVRADGEGPASPARALDELYLARPERGLTEVGTVASASEGVVVVALSGREAPLHEPLLVEGQTRGVVVLILPESSGRALGIMVEGAPADGTPAAPAPGARLLRAATGAGARPENSKGREHG